jgi:hypothetical protein
MTDSSLFTDLAQAAVKITISEGTAAIQDLKVGSRAPASAE